MEAEAGNVVASIDNRGTLEAGSQFETFEQLEAEVRRFAQQRGFNCGKSTHKMDDARSQLIFARSAVQRGTFYCTSKIHGKCSFKVPFTFMFAQRHYIIKDTDGLNLDHNHSVDVIPESSDVLVRFERDLYPSEKDLMITCGCHANAPLLRRILATQFPQRHYDSHLIQRMIKKSKVANFGSDPDGMKTFFAFGTDISNSGGIFQLEFEEDLRINGAIVQTTAMEKYCRSYSDFTLLDGTFNISVYSLILLVFSNIDCLGKTVIGGIGFAPSENSRSVIKAYQTFYQYFTGASVLMTDGASAFETAACELRLRHLLCTKHFQKSILHCHRGMNSEFRNTFMRDCHSLLCTIFDSEVSFLDFFNTFYAIRHCQLRRVLDCNNNTDGFVRFQYGRTHWQTIILFLHALFDIVLY